jgi:hypothetical protein
MNAIEKRISKKSLEDYFEYRCIEANDRIAVACLESWILYSLCMI